MKEEIFTLSRKFYKLSKKEKLRILVTILKWAIDELNNLTNKFK